MTEPDWSCRLAGALVTVVGVLNAGFGLLSLLTDSVQLSAGVAGGLLTAGLVTVAAGALVWRGSRIATAATLTVFTMLLVFQFTEVIADDGAAADGAAEQHVARFVILLVLVAALGVAAWRGRRARVSTSAR